MLLKSHPFDPNIKPGEGFSHLSCQMRSEAGTPMALDDVRPGVHTSVQNLKELVWLSLGENQRKEDNHGP